MTSSAAARFLSFFLLLSALSASVAAELPRYKHEQVSVYPIASIVHGAVTLDGALNEWNPRAFITMYADPDLQEIFSCKLAFAYNASGLFLAGRFADASPLSNVIDPAVDPFRGWAGDALQIRLIADATLTHPIPEAQFNNDAIDHLTLWYYTAQHLPVLDIRHGMDFHGAQTLTGKGVALQYRPIAGGYTLEGFIPWRLLAAPRAPKPGERWVFTVQPQWGDAAGKHQHSFFDVMTSAGFHFQRPDGWGYARFVAPAEVNRALAEQAATEARLFGVPVQTARATIPVHYTNPAKGFVSLAICKPGGSIVRTLLTKAARPAGTLTEAWDGLDDTGTPVSPGAYTVKALTHQGIVPKFVTSVHNSGHPSWGNGGGRYGWGADHGLPINAAADPDGNTYLLWTFNEGGNFLIKVDATGQKQWGASISWGDFNGGATALVYDNGVCYVTKDGASNGKGRGGLFAYDAKTGARTNFPNGQGTVLVSEWTPTPDHAPVQQPLWERVKSGNFDIADYSANLVGLAVSADRLYCALYQDDQVIALDKKTFARVASYAVPRPGNLVWDAATKTVLAISGQTVVRLDPTNGGKVTPVISTGLQYPVGLAVAANGTIWVSVRGAQMQVLGFDRDGKPTIHIGSDGGRPWIGKYDPKGMLLPAGICVDARQQLWVTEYDSTPKRVSLWDTRNGKLINEFFGSASYAPMMAPDPDKPEEVYLHNCRFLVDYATGTVTPDATVYRANLTGPSIPGSEAGYGFMGATFEIARYGGKTYALNGNGGVFAVNGDRFTPILYIGNAYAGMPTAQPFQYFQPVVWRDANGDGVIQAEEVRAAGGGGLYNNIAQFGATFYPGAGIIKSAKLFRPTGIDGNGYPIYPRPEEAEPIITGKGPMAAYSNWMDVWPSFSSNWQEFYAIASLPRGGALDGAGMDGVYRFNRNGDIRWRYSRVAVFYALKSPLAKIGDLYGALRIAGEVSEPAANGGEIVGIGVYRGYFGFLNEDGLFIDQVGYDNGRGPSPNFDVFYIENFSGYFFKHPKTGKVYLFCGDVDGRILELQGWTSIRRLPDTSLTISDAQFQAIQTAALSNTGGNVQPPLVVAAGSPALDGSMKGWGEKTQRTITLDETHAAKINLAYTATALYARFAVQDATPWQNTGADWHYLFKGGDAVDLQLGVINPTLEMKRKTQLGDVRVFIAPTAGEQCLVVGMWKIVPDGMTKAPQRYQSPVGEENFECVKQLQHIVCHVRRTTTGYVLEVMLPWSELGMKPPATRAQLQGDVGVLLSDAGGARTTGRRYLFNQETSIINDVPSEVRVECDKWGIVLFE